MMLNFILSSPTIQYCMCTIIACDSIDIACVQIYMSMVIHCKMNFNSYVS